MEKTSHQIRSNLIKVIDVNLEYLDDVFYNESNKLTNVEEGFIIFVDSNIGKLEKYFKGDQVMEKVVDMLKSLTEEGSPLYYDHEEFHEMIVRADAEEKGIKSGKKSIIINMLNKNYDDKDILQLCEISQKELDDIKQSFMN